MPVPKDLLDIMACAFCKGDLRLDDYSYAPITTRLSGTFE